MVELVGPATAALQLLQAGTPGFLSRMGPKNLRARGAATVEDYVRIYRAGVLDWSEVPHASGRALSVAVEAKAACRSAGMPGLAGMPWRLACSARGRTVENGYAHTVGDVVVLPLEQIEKLSRRDLISLMIHESVHVAQRMDPERARLTVARMWGFVPASPDTLLRLRVPEVRANPDTDAEIYERAGVVCQPVFTPDPRSLADIRLMPHQKHAGLEWVHNPEHPFEVMAEYVADAVMGFVEP